MRCPVCRAADNQTAQCRRCKADLSLLVRLEATRRDLLARASQDCAVGDARESWQHAAQADALRSDSESVRGMALAYLMARDFRQAWEFWQRLRSTGASPPLSP